MSPHTSRRLRRATTLAAAGVAGLGGLALVSPAAQALASSGCTVHFASPTISSSAPYVDLDATGDSEVSYSSWVSVDGGTPFIYSSPEQMPMSMGVTMGSMTYYHVSSTFTYGETVQGTTPASAADFLCSDTLTVVTDTDPGTTDPGTTDPGTTDPGTTTPGTDCTVEFASPTISAAAPYVDLDATGDSGTAYSSWVSVDGGTPFIYNSPEQMPMSMGVTWASMSYYEASSTFTYGETVQGTTPASAADFLCSDTLTLVNDTTDPGTDPGTTDPGTTDPGTTDPGTTEPATPRAVLTLRSPRGVALSAGSTRVAVSSTGRAAIAVRSLTPAVCRVEGGSDVRLLAAGTCRLRAEQGADAAHRAPAPAAGSFAVWAAPSVPKAARTTRVLHVLGAGEEDLTVQAGPAAVCRPTGGEVVLIAGGRCHVTVRDARGRVVRTSKVKVSLARNPKAVQDSMRLGTTVYFRFDSDRLTAAGKRHLRRAAPELRRAKLVVLYGNTYGPGHNGRSSQALSARRAGNVARFLSRLGVTATVTKVGQAMHQPVSKTPSRNRRVEVYYR